MRGKDLHFSVAYATLRPDFLALLRGEFVPRNISLLRPKLGGALPAPGGHGRAGGRRAGTAAACRFA